MNSILSHFQMAPVPFRPGTIGEYIVLQVARKLKDTDNISFYVHLLSEFSQEQITTAFANTEGGDRDRFRAFLKPLRQSQHAATDSRSSQAA